MVRHPLTRKHRRPRLYDARFHVVQALELLAGATNSTLMGLNGRDGLRLSGRLRSSPPEKA
jgi:hypothetical protein